jgi:hypothetical protein
MTDPLGNGAVFATSTFLFLVTDAEMLPKPFDMVKLSHLGMPNVDISAEGLRSPLDTGVGG